MATKVFPYRVGVLGLPRGFVEFDVRIADRDTHLELTAATDDALHDDVTLELGCIEDGSESAWLSVDERKLVGAIAGAFRAGVASWSPAAAAGAYTVEPTTIGPPPAPPPRVTFALAERGTAPTPRPPWAKPPTVQRASGQTCCGCRTIGVCVVFYGDRYRPGGAGEPEDAFFAFCNACVADMGATS